MKKYYILILLAFITLILIFFFISTKSISTKNIIENKKVDIKKNEQIDTPLVEQEINTKLEKENKNYLADIDYNKPKDNPNKVNIKKEDTKFGIDVDINKDTKEFEKVRFGLEKKF